MAATKNKWKSYQWVYLLCYGGLIANYFAAKDPMGVVLCNKIEFIKKYLYFICFALYVFWVWADKCDNIELERIGKFEILRYAL